MKKQKVFIPVSVEDGCPPFSDDILVSFDGGITFPESAAYRSSRKCMLAVVGGGNGYFGKGFCTNGSTGCDDGLILFGVTHWLKKQEGYFFTPESLKELVAECVGFVWGKYGTEKDREEECKKLIESLNIK